MPSCVCSVCHQEAAGPALPPTLMGFLSFYGAQEAEALHPSGFGAQGAFGKSLGLPDLATENLWDRLTLNKCLLFTWNSNVTGCPVLPGNLVRVACGRGAVRSGCLMGPSLLRSRMVPTSRPLSHGCSSFSASLAIVPGVGNSVLGVPLPPASLF